MVDETMRRSFHERLDLILDLRSELEVPAENALAALLGNHHQQVHSESGAGNLFDEAVQLARDILGEGVRRAGLRRKYKKGEEERTLLRSWLLAIAPLVAVQPSSILALIPEKELSLFDVIDALSALDAGEIRPLFAANTGKNRRANRWSLAQTKLQALVWKKRLLALGHAEKSANYEITKAFGEQWDTMRRWKVQCEQILGADHVKWELAYAGSSTDMYIRPPAQGMFGNWRPNPDDGLMRDGNAYQQELRRSAELSKRKSRAVA